MAGGPTAFDEIWLTARERLTRALRAQGFDEATAEDAVAEAAARAVAQGLVSEDLDDFCRWAFIVARNVARDATRRGSRVVLFDVMPDRVDAYDLAGEVESRHDLREAAAAMRTLSDADRGALLHSLNADDDPAASRREAVKHAVRRHRARVRLRHALGQAGGFFGWLRRPWAWRLDVLGAYDRAGAALLAPLLGMTMGLLSPVDPRPVGAGEVAAVDGVGNAAVTAAVPVAAAAPATTTSSVRSAGDGAAGGGPAPAVSSDTPTGLVASFNPSPRYEEDHTVFLSTYDRGERCGHEQASCNHLYKSTDGGATWNKLPAKGWQGGELMLSQAYPRDPRIFSNGTVVTVSEDGGRTFRPLGASSGSAVMSPAFAAGDPRILFGSQVALGLPPRQYVDGDPTLTPVVLPLPPYTVPLRFWFSNDFARDGRILVYAADTAVTPEDTLGTRPGPHRYRVFSCTQSTCDPVIEEGVSVIVDAAWTRPGTVFFDAGQKFYKSTDSGQTFTEVDIDWHWSISMVRASIDNSLLARSKDALHISYDDGESWRRLPFVDLDFNGLTVLPDGVILVGSYVRTSAVACSLDGGLTWQDPCRRPPAS